MYALNVLKQEAGLGAVAVFTQKRADLIQKREMNIVCCVVVLHLCNFIMAPEAGVVQRGVPMLIDCVGIRFALNQLPSVCHTVRKQNNKTTQ